PALRARRPARLLNDDGAHGARRGGEELGAPAPAAGVGIDEPQIGLVHEAGRRERLPGRGPVHQALSQPPQLAVEIGDEFLRLLLVLPRLLQERQKCRVTIQVATSSRSTSRGEPLPREQYTRLLHGRIAFRSGTPPL